MGVAARRIDSQAPARHRVHLRVVPVKAPSASRRPRSGAARAEAARTAFRSFAIIVTLAAVLGGGRVWLSVKAAEASMKASQLRGDIKNERYEGDMLEVRQSALGSPSRIQAIAGAAMGMTPAKKVSYLEIAPKSAPRPAAEEDESHHVGFSKVINGMMELTAGEAQVLLVGDVGLASSK